MTTEMTDRERWLHDLRNAVNTTGMALAVTKRLLAAGDTARAAFFLSDAETGCETCRVLLHSSADPSPQTPDGRVREE